MISRRELLAGAAAVAVAPALPALANDELYGIAPWKTAVRTPLPEARWITFEEWIARGNKLSLGGIELKYGPPPD